MASWLVCSTPERAVWVRALSGDIVLYSWARHLTLTVPLSTQVYKWVPVNLLLRGKLPCDGLASHPGGSRNTPSRFMLTETGISSGLMGQLARMHTLCVHFNQTFSTRCLAMNSRLKKTLLGLNVRVWRCFKLHHY